MGLFKNEEDAVANEDYLKALEAFEKQEFQTALGILAQGFRKDVNFPPLYELSAKCLAEMGGQEEANLFAQVLNNFQSFDAFNQLGTHFYEVGHYDMAIPFLEKAVSISTANTNTVHDLALVYARRFQIEKGLETLEKIELRRDFWNYWFWCKLRILAGKPEGTREGLDQLAAVLAQELNPADVAFPRQKVEEVKELLRRYELLENPRKHIQDWHFIQYGNVILDFFEDTEDYVAGGRYVASWGNHHSIKGILQILKTYLKAFGLNFQGVKFLPNRDSEIIGLAVGQELQLTADAYQQNDPAEHCLIVAANNTDFNDYPELSTVQNGQVLFALNHNWLNSSLISPDIVGFMNQHYTFPWEGGSLRILDAEKGTSERTQPDHRPASEIATAIFGENPEQEIDQAKLDFYLRYQDYLKGIGSAVNHQRFNFMIESPVPGSYFG